MLGQAPCPDGSHGGTMKSDCHRRPNGHPGDIPTVTETHGFMFGRPRARTVHTEAPRNVIATEDRTGTRATSPQSLRHRDSCLASPAPGRFTWRHHEMQIIVPGHHCHRRPRRKACRHHHACGPQHNCSYNNETMNYVDDSESFYFQARCNNLNTIKKHATTLNTHTHKHALAS